MTIKTLFISFDLRIKGSQLNQWRGAFLEMAGWQNDLFHNHKSKHEHLHRYPLIQYRIKDGYAGIYAIAEGVQAVQQVLANTDWIINWNDQPKLLRVEDMQMQQYQLQTTEQPIQYQVYAAQLLNPENFKKWQTADDFIERAALLQQQIGNYVMVALWAMGWQQKGSVQVKLQQIRKMQPIRYMGATKLSFDVTFSANVVLPELVGIGRGVSHGYGWTVPMLDKPQPERKRFSAQAIKHI